MTGKRIAAAAVATLGATLVLAEKPEAPSRAERTFEFTYEVTVKDLPGDARSVRIWIPEATSDPGQSVTLKGVTGPVRTIETRDAEFGNHILYAEIPRPTPPTVRFALEYTVTRRQYSGVPEGRESSLGQTPLSRFLLPDSLVPIDGRIKELADSLTRGKGGPREMARAVYDYIFKTLRYDKSGTGWGRGDAVWACNAKRGNCTDFHSLFIALMRAEKIPARFEIGFPLPKNFREGEIPGYHCWAEFFVDGEGWIPVDVSEASQTPARRDFFFGSLDPSRVQFSVGRDIVLTPRQEGGALNYFVYPYVEVDGKPFDHLEKRFSFRDIPAPVSSTGGR